MQRSSILSFCFLLSLLSTHVHSISADNVCTFHIGGKLFSLLYLDIEEGYELEVDS